jgi:hypothetical protein
MARKGYTVCGEFFKTKAAIRERVRSILYAYPTGTRVSSKDSAFLLELLHNHPNAEEKIGCGVEAFEVRQESSISRCFYLIRIDGSTENFSYEKLLSPPTRLAVFKAVCRTLVYRQVLRFKSAHFRQHAREDGRVQCPITRKWIMQEEAHVDHIPPDTFAKLLANFTAQYDIDAEKIEIQDSGSSIGKTFADADLTENWMRYHEMNAKLRVVSTLANLTIIPHREQALSRISNNYELSLVYELEPVRTESLVDLALDCTYVEWRQEDLELLKMYASRLVGSEAVHPELRAEKYEIALHAFLDWLLPEEIANAMEVAS